MSETSGIRRRLLVVSSAVLLMAASGVMLNRTTRSAPAQTPLPAGGAALSGTWFCPHGGSAGWSGWVVVTNSGSRSVWLRLTSLGSDGRRVLATSSIGPSTQRYFAVPVTDPGASTEVEYFGGWVGAAAVVRSGGEPVAVAAERCAPAPRRTWFVPDATTASGQSASLVVMNPFGRDAEFNVLIRSERRSIRPGPLSPYVVRAGHSVSIRLNSFALQELDERSFTAELESQIGRVVAGAVGVSADGIREEAAVPQAARRWFIPSTGSTGTSQLTVMNPGPVRAYLSILSQGRQTEQLASGISVAARGVQSYPVGLFPGTGEVVQSTNGRPVAVALQVTGPKGDVASITGAPGASRRWLLLPPTPPTGGIQAFVLQNPGRASAMASIRLIGLSFLPGFSSVVVPAGGIVEVRLPRSVRTHPTSALVTVRGGTVVASAASYGLDGTGFAATIGLPVPNSG